MSPLFKTIYQSIQYAEQNHIRSGKLKIRLEDRCALKADPDAPKYLELKPNALGEIALFAFGVEGEFV